MPPGVFIGQQYFKITPISSLEPPDFPSKQQRKSRRDGLKCESRLHSILYLLAYIGQLTRSTLWPSEAKVPSKRSTCVYDSLVLIILSAIPGTKILYLSSRFSTGPVVQKPINANAGSKQEQWVVSSCLELFLLRSFYFSLRFLNLKQNGHKIAFEAVHKCCNLNRNLSNLTHRTEKYLSIWFKRLFWTMYEVSFLFYLLYLYWLFHIKKSHVTTPVYFM